MPLLLSSDEALAWRLPRSALGRSCVTLSAHRLPFTGVVGEVAAGSLVSRLHRWIPGRTEDHRVAAAPPVLKSCRSLCQVVYGPGQQYPGQSVVLVSGFEGAAYPLSQQADGDPRPPTLPNDASHPQLVLHTTLCSSRQTVVIRARPLYRTTHPIPNLSCTTPLAARAPAPGRGPRGRAALPRRRFSRPPQEGRRRWRRCGRRGPRP